MSVAHRLQRIESPISWSEIPHGDIYRQAIDQHLQVWWPKIFGYHLVKLEGLSAEIQTQECAIPHQINVSVEESHLTHVIAESDKLPFLDKSVDACLLAHSLSYSSDPHAVLREADRILIDDGWLIITGFNPCSLLGAGKLIPFLNKKSPYHSQMFTQFRLLDWLKLLNYEVLERSQFQIFSRYTSTPSFFECHLPALGRISLIVARKRTLPLTLNPLRMKLRQRALGTVLGGVTKNCRNRDEL